MRDPAGTIAFNGDRVERSLTEPTLRNHFLKSDLASEWVARGDLIEFEWVDDSSVHSRRIPFVTHPSEWTSDQFHHAASLTLALQSEANAAGWDLKDASAWNIVFDGLRPIFVDLLSLEPLTTKRWWAAGQFVRHFLLPLLLDRHGHLESSQCFQLWRDGVPPDVARQCLGWRRFGSRYWPLMTRGDGNGIDVDIPQVGAGSAHIQNFRLGLNATMSWMLSGLTPMAKNKEGTVWARYQVLRDHYSEQSLSDKKKIVSEWLMKIRPAWVLDVGCNAGEFSEIVVLAGARVVCWDADRQALTTLCRKHRDDRRFFPVLGSVDNTPGGMGWMGEEFPGLPARMDKRFDVVMLLAVTHHLAIANSVPLMKIFEMARSASRSFVLVEMLSDSDVRVQQLCRQHKRRTEDFTVPVQYRAAEACGLKLIESRRLGQDGKREIALFGVP